MKFLTEKTEVFIKYKPLHILASIGAGLILGIIVTLNYANIAKRCEIVVIARQELLQLEKERIKGTGEKDLFFGTIGPDLQRIIATSANRYQSRKIKVLFVSYGGISGENARSITREVHRDVIKTLQAQRG